VTFPCVIASDGVMHVARIGAEKYVYFDETSENFTTVDLKNATGITASLSVQAPFLGWGSVKNVVTLPTKETTLGVIIPTTEINGLLKNLNYIEDELTDI
jgi:hypothetical protein